MGRKVPKPQTFNARPQSRFMFATHTRATQIMADSKGSLSERMPAFFHQATGGDDRSPCSVTAASHLKRADLAGAENAVPLQLHLFSANEYGIEPIQPTH
jgi:hypothetical protein